MSRLGITLYGFGLGCRAAIDLAVRAGEHGFASVFLVERVLSNDVLTIVAAIAATTKCITVGTGIANVFLRHPVMLGIAAVAIDEISDGRLILGLGPNNQAMIERAGLTLRDPRVALRETTETLRAVFSGRGAPGMRPPPPAQHRIPIHWAAMALETVEQAGAHADGLMLYLCTRERYQRAVARMRRGAPGAGRDPAAVTVSLLIPTFLADDLEVAQQSAREFLVHYAGMPHYARTFRASGFEAEMDAVAAGLAAGDRRAAMDALSDRLLDEVVLLGPAARCRDGLATFRAAGGDYATIAPQRTGDNDLITQASILIEQLSDER